MVPDFFQLLDNIQYVVTVSIHIDLGFQAFLEATLAHLTNFHVLAESILHQDEHKDLVLECFRHKLGVLGHSRCFSTQKDDGIVVFHLIKLFLSTVD